MRAGGTAAFRKIRSEVRGKDTFVLSLSHSFLGYKKSYLKTKHPEESEEHGQYLQGKRCK